MESTATVPSHFPKSYPHQTRAEVMLRPVNLQMEGLSSLPQGAKTSEIRPSRVCSAIRHDNVMGMAQRQTMETRVWSEANGNPDTITFSTDGALSPRKLVEMINSFDLRQDQFELGAPLWTAGQDCVVSSLEVQPEAAFYLPPGTPKASAISRTGPINPLHLTQAIADRLTGSRDSSVDEAKLSDSASAVFFVGELDSPVDPSTPDQQMLISPRKVTPFPMLGDLRATYEDEAAALPHRPGYATPMRTSVVELMPLASQLLRDDADTSPTSCSSTPDSPHHMQANFTKAIHDFRIQRQHPADCTEMAPSSAPTRLPAKPKLTRFHSSMDGVGSSPVLTRDSPSQSFLKPSAEVSWDEITFDSAQPLGDGNEGNVLLAHFRGQQVAVKVGGHERIVKEQKLMAKLRHPHVVRTLGHAKRRRSNPDNTDSLSYAGIYEYCHQRDLMSYLAQSTARSDVGKMTQIFDDILAGLEYIHDNHEYRQTRGSIVHGDVKPENIMIDLDGRAKLGDFGLAQYQSTNMDVQGTPSYIAPEVVLDFLAGSPHPKFTTKADVFSFGVLMVVALTGHYPFKRLTAKLHSGQMTVAQVIKHFTPSRRTLKAINDISPRFKRMVDSCLCRYPEMRPSASQLRALLYRRSKSTGEDGAILVPRKASTATLAAPADSATPTQASSTSIETLPGPTRMVAAPATKVPPSLAHIVHGMSTPLIPIPVSSGKYAGDS